jgi:hypothetical protein
LGRIRFTVNSTQANRGAQFFEVLACVSSRLVRLYPGIARLQANSAPRPDGDQEGRTKAALEQQSTRFNFLESEPRINILTIRVTDEQIAALDNGDTRASCFTNEQQAVFAFSDEVMDLIEVTDKTYDMRQPSGTSPTAR